MTKISLLRYDIYAHSPYAALAMKDIAIHDEKLDDIIYKLINNFEDIDLPIDMPYFCISVFNESVHVATVILDNINSNWGTNTAVARHMQKVVPRYERMQEYRKVLYAERHSANNIMVKELAETYNRIQDFVKKIENGAEPQILEWDS